MVVEPVDPVQGCHLDGRSVRPGSSPPDDLGFVDAAAKVGIVPLKRTTAVLNQIYRRPIMSDRSIIKFESDMEIGFYLICRLLGSCGRETVGKNVGKYSEFTDGFWSSFVQTYMDQMVGPSISSRSQELDLASNLHPLVLRHSQALLQLNRRRNGKLRDEAIDLASKLNAVDLVPILLKGGAGLVSGLYSDAGARVMSGLDVLVPRSLSGKCEQVMADMGYHRAPKVPHPREKLIGVFSHRDLLASIDLHGEVMEYPNQNVLTAQEVIAESEILTVAGARLGVPSITHQIVNNVAHAQLNDHAMVFGQFPLRALHDFSLMVNSAPDRIDWEWICARFAAEGRSSELAFHCLAASRLMGTPVPAGVMPSRATNLLYRRAEYQVSRPGLQKYGSRVLRPLMLLRRELSDPALRIRLLRNIFNPAWWRRHLGFVWGGRRN